MQDPFFLSEVFAHRFLDDLAIRTHNEGISNLAAAALIDHEGKFLLVEAPPTADFDTAGARWELPTGRILAGETLFHGLCRVLAEHYGYESVQISRYLGHIDRRHEGGYDVRVFTFAVTPEQPDSICRTAHIGHRWIDSDSISRTVEGIDPILRAYYADTTI